MKTYICKKCIAFGGKDPCTLTCEDDMKPTHCPHDDSAYPNPLWEEVLADSPEPDVQADAVNLCLCPKHFGDCDLCKDGKCLSDEI